ncbi:MAG: hypothetical protein WBB23_19610 [Desulforhopalus sp.]
MKVSSFTIVAYSRFFFLFFVLLLAVPVHGAQFEEDVSTDEYLFVKGIVQSISLEEQKLTLKQKNGEKISFSIGEDTILEGFYKLTELPLRQKIKVWYKPKGQENKALKILKPLELGC